MALALRKEEGLGLGIAIAAHVAIIAVLLLRPHSAPVVTPPERIEVTISDDVGLTSTSPSPNSQAAPPVAPTLGEPKPEEQAPAESEPDPAPPEPAPPEPAPPKPAPPKPTPPKPAPRPVPRKVERPTPKPVPRTPERPRETARPTPAKPVAKAAPTRPTPRPVTRPSPAKAPARPASASATKSPQKGTAKSPSSKTATANRAPAGGSKIGSDFLAGVTGATSNTRAPTSAPPAAAIGPAVKASLASSISRALKPKWQAPQGPDAEELVTILSFSLNRDGSLAGSPTVVRQLGINDMNRNQAARHAEQAVKAVRLAAPFDLPPEYYDAWKRVSAFRFDKRLSQ